MADEVIKQDSASIRKIGEDLINNAESFLKATNEMFEEIGREIGADPSHLTWHGPNAQAFVMNVNLKKPEFVKAAKNLEELGNNLVDQSDSWNTFESN